MTDTTLQRLNMVESQVRPSDITDRRIINALREVPRELFVPASQRSIAYMDEALTVAPAAGNRPARQMLAPRTFAKLLQLASLGDRATVLDVGCASGYSTAVLARIARRVIGLEIDQSLADQARAALADRPNASITTGALADGYATAGPYDAIIVEGALPFVPAGLLDQLKDGGRLVAILASGRAAEANVWQRSSGQFSKRPAFDAWGPALPGFEVERAFAL